MLICVLVFCVLWASCVYRMPYSVCLLMKGEVKHLKRMYNDVGTHPWLLFSSCWLYLIMEMLKHIKKLKELHNGHQILTT